MSRVRPAAAWQTWISSNAVRLLRLLAWPPLWLLLAAMLGGVVLAYQRPRDYIVGVGTPSDQAYVRNFHARLDDNGRAYRWSDVYGFVDFPGLGGSRPFTLTMDLDSARPAPVTLIVNGEELFREALQPGWQTVTLRVDNTHPAALASRDTVLEIRAPDFRTEDLPSEPKGVKVGDVRIEQDRAGGFITPPYARLVYFVLAVLLAYLATFRAVAGFASKGRALAWALAGAGLLSAAIVAAVAWNHVAASAAALHGVVTLVSMGALLIISEGLARRVRVPAAAARLLAVCVALGFGLRYGGMALPQSVIVDMPWHMKWLRTLLSGDWQSLYFPGGLSSVPREWGLDLLIPKSPLFYFAAAPLSLIPFDLETLVKWLICLLDVSVIGAVFWLARRAGRGFGAAAWAAGLYAVMPLAFRAFSYGIVPTIFAQWLAALVIVWALYLAGRRAGVAAWVGWTLLTCLALLAFPTVAAFLSLVLVGATLAWWALAGKPGRTGTEMGRTGQLVRVLGGLAAAWLLAIWAYYGLYLGPMLTSAQALLAPRPGGGSTVRWPGGLPELLGWTAAYVASVLPALLALVGLVLIFSARRGGADEARARWLLLTWALVAPVFVLVNLRVDMIGKHLFFTMAPFAVLGGIALFALWARGRAAGLLASLAMAAIAWQGLVFWIGRLLGAST